MDNILDGIREINLGGLLRYGSPDIHFLATLKNEIHIYDILGFFDDESDIRFEFR